MFAIQFIIPVCLVIIGRSNHTGKDFEIPDWKQYYFQGRENDQSHHLTMGTDSTFHITVPNNSGSCWTWGEYGGKISIQSDTVKFHFNSIQTKSTPKEELIESFISDPKRNLIRISSKQFMFEHYRLKKRRGNIRGFELE